MADKNSLKIYLSKKVFKEYLELYLVSIGVDWYVRLLRNNDIERDVHGHPFFKPEPEPFDYSRRRDYTGIICSILDINRSF